MAIKNNMKLFLNGLDFKYEKEQGAYFKRFNFLLCILLLKFAFFFYQQSKAKISGSTPGHL